MPRIIEGKRMNITGNKVKEFRKERNLSQQELSNQPETLVVCICRGSISRIEDGSRTVTDIGAGRAVGDPACACGTLF